MIYMAYNETPNPQETAMLGRKGKHALKISLDRENGKDSNNSEEQFIRPETVKLAAERTKEVAKFVAITAVAAYTAIKTVETISKVVLKKTKSADKKED
jgi:hypothetical protein